MKISTSVASARLGMHPMNIVLQLSEMVGQLNDCWPEIDEGLVATLEALARPHTKELAVRSEGKVSESFSKPARPHEQLKILDKLGRQERWGGNSVSWDTLRNHYCRNIRGLREAVEHLVADGLLISRDDRQGPFSLNPARKGEIETLIEKLR